MKQDNTLNAAETQTSSYGCGDYRQEMILLSLLEKLKQTDLTEEERTKLLQDIAEMEKIVGL